MPEHPVKKRRRELGLRLTDLADAVGRSKPLVSMVESGYIPKPHTCEAFAKALDTTVEALWPEGRFE